MNELHKTLHLIALKFFENERGVVLPLDDPEMLSRSLERRRTGRYTLEEAALFVALNSRASAKNILTRMLDAIARRTLAIYQPWRNEAYLTAIVMAWRDEVYGDDMNVWLEANEPKIGVIFPCFKVGTAVTIAKITELDHGVLPRVGIGKLVIKAALEIEGETERVATRDQVLERLQMWATNGSFPDVLHKVNPSGRAVIWTTKKGATKLYDSENCGKALEVWGKTRKRRS